LGGSKPGEMEISQVINVTHQQHVGLREDGTFDMNDLSPEWRAFFKQAGVKKSDLTNPETAKAVMQSIQVSGFSLAAAPGKYVQASSQKPIAGPVALGKNQAVSSKVPVQSYSQQELKSHYTLEQIAAYEQYQRELAEFERAQRQYEEELAEYERQMALMTWEQDNTTYLQQHETERRTSVAEKFKAPPPLPPRKDKKQASSNDVLSSTVQAPSPAPAPPTHAEEAKKATLPPLPARLQEKAEKVCIDSYLPCA